MLPVTKTAHVVSTYGDVDTVAGVEMAVECNDSALKDDA